MSKNCVSLRESIQEQLFSNQEGTLVESCEKAWSCLCSRKGVIYSSVECPQFFMTIDHLSRPFLGKREEADGMGEKTA
jgi:hypothetical protein